jgi:accessory gene regulator protein AgrB
LNELGLILYVGETIGCVVFCVLFMLRSTWWKTSVGQNMLAMMFVLAVFQGLSLLRLVLAPGWYEANAVTIRFWTFLCLFIVVWWRVLILWLVQHEEAVERKRIRLLKPRRLMDDTDPDLLDDQERIRD